MPTVSQRELEGRLWDSANSLRGPVDPGDFKAYVFLLLFFKWISDTWDWEHAQAVADFGDRVSGEEEADYHRFDIPEDCHWADVRKTTSNLGVKLRNVVDTLERANPAKLAGIFGDVAWATRSGWLSRRSSISSTPSTGRLSTRKRCPRTCWAPLCHDVGRRASPKARTAPQPGHRGGFKVWKTPFWRRRSQVCRARNAAERQTTTKASSAGSSSRTVGWTRPRRLCLDRSSGARQSSVERPPGAAYMEPLSVESSGGQPGGVS
jgi:hypothetical protein